MLHWPDDRVAVIIQPPAAKVAADDADFGLAIVLGRVAARDAAGLRFA